MTKNAIHELGWEVLLHASYFDFAPSDYHPFQPFSNCLRDVSFNNNIELKMWFDEFFESRPGDFYHQGINKLVEHWKEVVNNGGEYIIG